MYIYRTYYMGHTFGIPWSYDETGHTLVRGWKYKQAGNSTVHVVFSRSKFCGSILALFTVVRHEQLIVEFVNSSSLRVNIHSSWRRIVDQWIKIWRHETSKVEPVSSTQEALGRRKIKMTYFNIYLNY